MPGQMWQTAADGGYLYADEISNDLRMEVLPLCKFRQLNDAHDFTKKGKRKGDTVHWDIFTRVSTAGTTVAEGTAIPQTKFTVYQGTATVDEWANSVPYTGKLDDLSKFEVKSIVRKVLAQDAKQALDTASYNQFNATKLRAVGGTAGTITLTTNGTATSTNSTDLSNSHVKTLVNRLKTRNIPPFINDDYAAIALPDTWRPLQDDLESIYQNTPEGYQRIIRGVIGRYSGCQFIEQTFIATSAWTNALSDWAFFFGADTVAEIVVRPEEIRAKIPDDYGRGRGLAWYALLGYSIVHKGDGTQGQVADVRIIKWDSAA